MSERVRVIPLVLLAGILAAGVAPPASGQIGGPYTVTWSTVDAGGSSESSAGVLALSGTIGQPDVAVATGGVFGLSGGYWPLRPAVMTGVHDPESTFAFRLHQASPNPFAGSTRIRFEIPSDGARARVRIFDLAGREVASLVDGVLGAGPHSVVWVGRDGAGRPVADGLYVCRVDVGGRSRMRKILYID